MPKDTVIDYYKLSHNSFNLFVKTVSRAISESKYALLLAGGDSGNIMAWITNAVYKNLGIAPPDTIVIPVYRHADYAETILFDNKILKSKIVLPKAKLKNILIVDDEVGTGNTVRGLLDTLSEATDDRPKVTFIAEDGGFDVSKITGWDVDYKAPQNRVKNVFNAVSYIVPYTEYQVPVKKVLGPAVEDMGDKHVMATLLNLPIKEFNDGRPEFTYKYRDLCLRQIDNFANMQKDFQGFICDEIKKNGSNLKQ